MKFIIYGAGALGSFIGAMLSKKYEVLLIGRKNHINEIEKNGLIIEGLTKGRFYPSVKWDGSKYDLIILTTKSYDTEKAVKEAISKYGKIPFLSLQNGLGNEEKIAEIIGEENVIGGITNHGITFVKPGKIRHAGKGITIIGELEEGKMSERIKKLAHIFNEVGIETKISKNIKKEIWRKAIINSAINSLTTLFKCKNGELIKYKKLVKKICDESILIAEKEGFLIEDAFERTMEVIEKTKNNYSSMLQDIMKGKKTEINEINGAIAAIGKKHGIKACFNIVLTELIKEMENVGT